MKKQKLLKKKKTQRPRVRGNTDSKKKIKLKKYNNNNNNNKLKLIKKNSTRAKISTCKIVCSYKSVFVQFCTLVQVLQLPVGGV